MPNGFLFNQNMVFGTEETKCKREFKLVFIKMSFLGFVKSRFSVKF
jgi:hypothetical protein